jgi:hypothetical protein
VNTVKIALIVGMALMALGAIGGVMLAGYSIILRAG